MAGLENLRGLFELKGFYDSVGLLAAFCGCSFGNFKVLGKTP